MGEGYLEQGELENAVAVFAAVADGVLERCEEFHDESGELGATVQRAVEGLGNSLAELIPAKEPALCYNKGRFVRS